MLKYPDPLAKITIVKAVLYVHTRSFFHFVAEMFYFSKCYNYNVILENEYEIWVRVSQIWNRYNPQISCIHSGFLKSDQIKLTSKLESKFYNTFPMPMQNFMSIEGQPIEKFQFQNLSMDHPWQSLFLLDSSHSNRIQWNPVESSGMELDSCEFHRIADWNWNRTGIS